MIMADNAISKDGARASRLIRRIVVAATEGSVLSRVGEEVAAMGGGVIVDCVIFPEEISFGKKNDVSRDRIHLVKTKLVFKTRFVGTNAIRIL